ncbi:MAG TPA: hypothetical protein VMO17_06275 [Terriglobia bacterium]|nr:hypothetical protein [Terriglobia bacterium]
MAGPKRTIEPTEDPQKQTATATGNSNSKLNIDVATDHLSEEVLGQVAGGVTQKGREG